MVRVGALILSAVFAKCLNLEELNLCKITAVALCVVGTILVCQPDVIFHPDEFLTHVNETDGKISGYFQDKSDVNHLLPNETSMILLLRVRG